MMGKTRQILENVHKQTCYVVKPPHHVIRIIPFMARQEDTILLTGLVDGLSYYKTKKGGYFVRRKSGVSRERIMSEPAFAHTRKNIAEFRTATLAATLVRRAFASLFECGADNRVSSRLTGRMVSVIQGDTKNPRGRRRVCDGNLSLLEGFAMNKKNNLSSVLRDPFSTSIDRVTGAVVIDLPSFIPAEQIEFPSGATHYCLRSGGAAIDFEKNTFSVDISATTVLPLSEELLAPLQLMHKVAASSQPMLVILGIEFLQVVNGTARVLHNDAYNAMAIIMAKGATPEETRHDVERPCASRMLLRRNASLTRTTPVRQPVRRLYDEVLVEDNYVLRTSMERAPEWKVDSS
jgi:hypothetical protein